MGFIFDKIENTFARNVTYSVVANIVYFFVGVAIILLVPKAIGVDEYGYFQLFLFYICFIGYTSFGWIDGVLLRYAGEKWERLNRAKFAGQIHCFLFFEILFWGIFAWYCYQYCMEECKLFVLLCTSICAILSLVKYFLRTILQAVNRIKVCSFLLLLERLIYLVSVLVVLFAGAHDFRFFVSSYLFSQLVAVVAAIWYCRSLVFIRGEDFCFIFEEAKVSIRAGIKLMLANAAALLVIAVIRFGIERIWGIATFGRISLVLSSLSVLSVFVNAVSVAILPSLRCEGEEYFRSIYLPSRIAFTWILLVCFIFAYPAAKILCLWLPDYADALLYLPLILPMCLFDCSVRILTGTYFLVIRREQDFLIGNLVALVVCIVLFIIFALIYKNLTLTVLSMTVALAARAWVLEWILDKRFNISAKPILVLELISSIVLVTTNLCFEGMKADLIYVIFLIAAFIVCRKTFWKTPLRVCIFFKLVCNKK